MWCFWRLGKVIVVEYRRFRAILVEGYWKLKKMRYVNCWWEGEYWGGVNVFSWVIRILLVFLRV